MGLRSQPMKPAKAMLLEGWPTGVLGFGKKKIGVIRPVGEGENMERAIVVRGILSDPLHIELAEPVTEVQGEIEIVVRSAPSSRPQAQQDIFDFIANLSPGTRSKEEIDCQLQEERNA